MWISSPSNDDIASFFLQFFAFAFWPDVESAFVVYICTSQIIFNTLLGVECVPEQPSRKGAWFWEVPKLLAPLVAL
jgi:hypothetical protein